MIPVQRDSLQSPSDLLAVVAAAIVESVVAPPPTTTVADWITEELRGDYRTESHWLRSYAELRDHAAVTRLSDPIEPASTVMGLANLIRAAQLLDIWHLPLIQSGSLPKTDEHVAAADRLHDHGRFNVDSRLGSLLPALAGNGPGPLDEELWHEGALPRDRNTAGALWPWLDATTFLPPVIAGQPPDRMREPGPSTEHRDIKIGYYRADPLLVTHPYLPAEPRVAIAPLVQTGREVHLIHTADRERYNLSPFYPASRLREVVAWAIEDGSQLLLIPEMAVAERRLPFLQDCIFDAATEFYQRTGQPSALAYVLAGVTSPGSDDDPGRNFLVVLNGHGEELFRQDKLSHWNIDPSQQAIFGLDAQACPLASTILEHSVAGDVLNIHEIAGLGRMVNCICSDLDQDIPLDWLLANARLDWLHAAIMDKSLCWVKSPSRPPWPARRAARAASRLRGKLVVTNSVGLTDWASETSVRKKSDYGPYAQAAIGLCVDARSGRIVQRLVFAELGQESRSVVEATDWIPQDWEEFPAEA